MDEEEKRCLRCCRINWFSVFICTLTFIILIVGFIIPLAEKGTTELNPKMVNEKELINDLIKPGDILYGETYYQFTVPDKYDFAEFIEIKQVKYNAGDEIVGNKISFGNNASSREIKKDEAGSQEPPVPVETSDKSENKEWSKPFLAIEDKNNPVWLSFKGESSYRIDGAGARTVLTLTVRFSESKNIASENIDPAKLSNSGFSQKYVTVNEIKNHIFEIEYNDVVYNESKLSVTIPEKAVTNITGMWNKPLVVSFSL